jgi:hypothetical protein
MLRSIGGTPNYGTRHHRANSSGFSSDALKVGPEYRATARWIFSDGYDLAFLFLSYGYGATDEPRVGDDTNICMRRRRVAGRNEPGGCNNPRGNRGGGNHRHACPSPL